MASERGRDGSAPISVPKLRGSATSREPSSSSQTYSRSAVDQSFSRHTSRTAGDGSSSSASSSSSSAWDSKPSGYMIPVHVSVLDGSGDRMELWHKIRPLLGQHLPLTNLAIAAKTSTGISLLQSALMGSSMSHLQALPSVDIEFAPFDDPRFEHQVSLPIDWWRRPFLHLYLCNAFEDSKNPQDNYKHLLRPKLKTWTAQMADKEQQYLIVAIQTGKRSLSLTQRLQQSVVDRLRSDFPRERVAFLRIADESSAKAEEASSWAAFMQQFRDNVATSFAYQLEKYLNETRKLEAEKRFPGWNFCNFFIVKEGLAFTFERGHLFLQALQLYNELERMFLERDASGIRVRPLERFFSLDQFDMVVEGRSKSLVDWSLTTKKAFRQLIYTSTITEFDLRRYIFSRQCQLYLTLSNHTPVAAQGLKFLRDMCRDMQEHCEHVPTLLQLCWAYAAATALIKVCEPSLVAYQEEMRKQIKAKKHHQQKSMQQQLASATQGADQTITLRNATQTVRDSASAPRSTSSHSRTTSSGADIFKRMTVAPSSSSTPSPSLLSSSVASSMHSSPPPLLRDRATVSSQELLSTSSTSSSSSSSSAAVAGTSGSHHRRSSSTSTAATASGGAPLLDEWSFGSAHRVDLTSLIAEYYALARSKLEEIAVICQLLPPRSQHPLHTSGSSSSSLQWSFGALGQASSPLVGPTGQPLPLELNDDLGRLFSAVRSGSLATAQQVFDGLYQEAIRAAIELFSQSAVLRPRLICSLNVELARFYIHRDRHREARSILKAVRKHYLIEQWYDLSTVCNELLAKCQLMLANPGGYLGACARLAVPWSSTAADERSFDQQIYYAQQRSASGERQVLPRGDSESPVPRGQFDSCSRYLREMLRYSKELERQYTMPMADCDMCCVIPDGERQRVFHIGDTPVVGVLLLSMFNEPLPCDRVVLTFAKQVSVGKSRSASASLPSGAAADAPDIELLDTNDAAAASSALATQQLVPVLRLASGALCLQPGWNALQLSTGAAIPHSARGRYACSTATAHFGRLALSTEIKSGRPGLEITVSRPSLDVALQQPTSLVSDIAQSLRLLLTSSDEVVSAKLTMSSSTGLRILDSEQLKHGACTFGPLAAASATVFDFSVIAACQDDCAHDLSIHTSYTKATGETFAVTNIFKCFFHRLFEVDHHYTPCGASAGVLQVLFRSATTNTVRVDAVGLDSPAHLSAEPIVPRLPLSLYHSQILSLALQITSKPAAQLDSQDDKHSSLALRLDCSLVVAPDDSAAGADQPAPFFFEISVPRAQCSAVVDYDIAATCQCGQFTPLKIHVHSLDPAVRAEHEYLTFQIVGSKHYIVSGLTRTRIASADIAARPGRTFEILLLPLAAGSLPLPQVQLSPINDCDTIISIDTKQSPSIQVLPVRNFSSAFAPTERT